MITYLPTIADHLLFFLLGIVMPFRSVKAQKKIHQLEYPTEAKIQMYWINGFGLWVMAVLTLLVWWFSDRLVSDLGLGWPPPAFNFAASVLLLLFLALYFLDVGAELGTQGQRQKTFERWAQDMPFLPAKDIEWLHFNFLSLSAGICEEIVFRGFFITYLNALFQFLPATTAQWLAVLVPAVIFGTVHYYQGWKAMLKISLMAILFGCVFVLTGSLWVLILVHVLIDVLGGAFSWWLHSRFGQAVVEEE
ncbi:MAG: CPBP family intramembrane glutamic endopeptidase [Saprospiraceae bacterium]